MKNHLFLYALAVVWASGVVAEVAEPDYVAGLHPYQRPAGAPQVTEAYRTPEQLERALYGVERPIPGNVEAIAATGNWWVSLRQPGMTHPYDLRNWHDAGTTSGNTLPAATPER